jgi:hypothetical protein
MIFIPIHPSKGMTLQDHLINIVGTYCFINFNEKNIASYSAFLTIDKLRPYSVHHTFVHNSF